MSIVNTTGCQKPCHFKVYDRIGYEGFPAFNITGLNLDFAGEEVTIEKEVEGYNEVMLLSDLGGSLGMLLGFSFYMLWDVFEKIGLWKIKLCFHYIYSNKN